MTAEHTQLTQQCITPVNWGTYILLIVLTLAGVAVCGILLAETYGVKPAVYDNLSGHLCGDSPAGAGTGCKEAFDSKYATFRGVPIPYLKVRLFKGLPAAAMGLMYFVGLLLWLVFAGRRIVLTWVPVLMAGCGALYSLYMIGILVSQQWWCGWCMVTHGINFAIVLIVILGALMRVRASTDQERQATRQLYKGTLVRAVVIVVLGMTTTATANMLQVVMTGYAQLDTRHKQVVKEYRGMVIDNPTFQYIKYERMERPHKIPVSEYTDQVYGDPILGPADAPVTLVVFDDFECPQCAKLAVIMDQVHTQFPDQLRIVFKHYPLHVDCNKHYGKVFHKHACQAARASEAVARIGGEEAFWKYEKLLFENQKDFGKDLWADWAEQVGVDRESFTQALAADDIEERIQRHIAEAATITKRQRVQDTASDQQDDARTDNDTDPTDGAELSGDSDSGKTDQVQYQMVDVVRGTPTLFLQGKQVTGWHIDGFLAKLIQLEIRRAQQGRQ